MFLFDAQHLGSDLALSGFWRIIFGDGLTISRAWKIPMIPLRMNIPEHDRQLSYISIHMVTRNRALSRA